MNRTRIIFNDVEEGSEWVTTYHLGYKEFDDDIDDDNVTEIIFNAVNFEVAVRYAQQYLRKMQTEESTSTEWANAQILSVEMH